MSFSHKITRACDDGVRKAALTATETVTAGERLMVDEAIPSNQTNLQLTFAFAVAKLQSIFILSNQNLTLKTNNSGSPQETISLLAGQPLEWSRAQGYFTCPFAGDVTTLYVTNTTAAQLQIAGVVDPT